MVPADPVIALPVFVLAAALIIDRCIGDPHSPLHPVALIGRFIAWWGKPGRYDAGLQRATGAVLWVVTVTVVAVPVFLFGKFAPWYLYLLIAPFLLKYCFAWRSLEEHAGAVIEALKDGADAGRVRVRMLVSRDTATLDTDQILSAAYESLAENLTDSIVSPFFWYSLFGLAGAAVYRAANTMDAMLGYRDERERLGWFSARMDDILNWIPARVTVILLFVYFACRGRLTPSYHMMRRDGAHRPGFNGGIVMAAMAGGAGVRFEKPGVYTIGDGERSLEEGGREILRAVRAVTLMAALAAACTLILLGTWINSMGI
ncbi:MAG: adenosylcobinamide-phosphate synthase CbiB [Methanoregula sp.]|nr:MAG: adenosylcobinamide-phosphate synthase CbiB [Methanoregula sp.]